MGSATIRILSVLGLVLSVYALYVEEQKERNPDYVALCDFSFVGSLFSCSKVFASEYGHLFFGLPNAVWGVFFYAATFLYTLLTFIPAREYLFFIAVAGASSVSVYLGYTLLVILSDFCVVCISTYFVNAFMLIQAFKEVQGVSAKKSKAKKQQ
jgi:vitamin-K-epoxide reductase (warfarin-sensitive)